MDSTGGADIEVERARRKLRISGRIGQGVFFKEGAGSGRPKKGFFLHILAFFLFFLFSVIFSVLYISVQAIFLSLRGMSSFRGEVAGGGERVGAL